MAKNKEPAWFAKFSNRTFLKDMPHDTVFKYLNDAFRYDQELACRGKINGDHDFYDQTEKLSRRFKKFLNLGNEMGDVLPSWWSSKQANKCLSFDTARLHMAFDEGQVVADWKGNPKDPTVLLQLRYLAAWITGRWRPEEGFTMEMDDETLGKLQESSFQPLVKSEPTFAQVLGGIKQPTGSKKSAGSRVGKRKSAAPRAAKGKSAAPRVGMGMSYTQALTSSPKESPAEKIQTEYPARPRVRLEKSYTQSLRTMLEDTGTTETKKPATDSRQTGHTTKIEIKREDRSKEAEDEVQEQENFRSTVPSSTEPKFPDTWKEAGYSTTEADGEDHTQDVAPHDRTLTMSSSGTFVNRV